MSIQKTITPIDNSVYLERPLSTQNEIDDVIENSKKSFQSWKNTSIEDRITIINKFIDNLIALKPEVSKEICWQIGRPISQCGNELRGFEERSRHMVKLQKSLFKTFLQPKMMNLIIIFISLLWGSFLLWHHGIILL